ncbi:S1 family peptidase [Prauserella flavalba]|uniref:S1 family peptidase n=1 Tax=Prauserella flavalba TaxID=1477506 RepID=UPI0036F17C3A
MVRRRLAAVLAAAVVLLCSWPAPASAVQPLLVGGVDADQNYPFMTALELPSGEHLCGASLVKPAWLVTAAHCVQGRTVDGFTARVGSKDRTQGGEAAKPAEIVVHPDYDPAGSGGDIALVRLTAPVKAAPVELGTQAAAGTATRLLGWGQTCPEQNCGPSPAVLKQLDTRIVDGKGCTGFDASVELCTGNPGGTKGACYGDSGGPQLVRVEERWQLVGVSSRPGNDDAKCATGPSIYTSVVAYTQWINDRTAPPPPPQEPEPTPEPTPTPTP